MIPTKQQWKKAWTGLDEAYAFDHFYGKTLEEAEDMIHELPHYYCEDFKWMPRVPFCFYFKAFKSYLISSRSKDNFYAAISFIGLIEHRVKYRYDWIKEGWPSIIEILNQLADHQDFYDGLTKPGKFRKKVNKIIAKQAEQQG